MDTASAGGAGRGFNLPSGVANPANSMMGNIGSKILHTRLNYEQLIIKKLGPNPVDANLAEPELISIMDDLRV